MKRILYIGRKDTYVYYKKGINPSHWLYGAAEMEKSGYEVVFEDEASNLLNDYKLLSLYKPDIIFIPNLNIHNHVFLLCLAALNIIGIPIFAFLHREPRYKDRIVSIIYKFLLSGCTHLFFLSELTMSETISKGLAKPTRCSFPQWGPDMVFYERVKTSDNGYFVSTGKEHRDFDILIEAFKRTKAPLKIYTSKNHAGRNYEDLPMRCKDISNIDVIITENSGEVFPLMLDAMAHAKAIVCPLRTDMLSYCVGLSTILDAEGLNKPLIITKNPYHSSAMLSDGFVVESIEDWVNIIEYIQENQDQLTMKPVSNMDVCWQNMKKIMEKY